MIRRCLLFFIAVCAALAVLAQTMEQTAGIYYAYPEPVADVTLPPEGYRPFYISHYGRHGSRWITDDYRYTDVLTVFDSIASLTELGMDVRERLQRVADDAIGRSGSLSPIGEKQHRSIASRMLQRYPEVFTDTSRIDAVSSTSVRCVMSMGAFTESLKEQVPSLRICRTAHHGDMDYIAHTTAQGKVFSANDAPWRAGYWAFVDENVKPERLISTLFVDPAALSPKTQRDVMTGLYWIASDMQDVEIDENFYDIFTYDEMKDMWRCINARMYVCNADSPLAGGVMKHCADNLLTDFISKADAAIASGSLSANLRFGHDTHLLRLLALIGVDGSLGQATDLAMVHEVWRDYSLSPMAANLQMVFYRNDDNDVIVKLLLNENEVCLPLLDADTTYYRWDLLREYLVSRLQK